MFAFWGRRGALCRFTLNLTQSLTAAGVPGSTISVARGNELFAEFAQFGDRIFPIDTFFSTLGALAIPRLLRLRRELEARMIADRTRAFVSLMPHVWSPLVTSVLRRNKIRHVAVVHDAEPHPGDQTAVLLPWLLREARSADRVVTLSRAVADRLIESRRIAPDKITVLFHPDIGFSPVPMAPPRQGALRVLFLGRVLPYKGLPLLVDAVDLLRQRGIPVHLGVYGAGDLGAELTRLGRLGAEVVNRWIAEDEFAAILGQFDVVVLSYTEASQSGVVAAAFGAGLPVIVTPVGGLAEQVVEGVNGLVAASVSPSAVAEAISQLVEDGEMLRRLQEGIRATAKSRSMESFRDALVSVALGSL